LRRGRGVKSHPSRINPCNNLFINVLGGGSAILGGPPPFLPMVVVPTGGGEGGGDDSLHPHLKW